MSKIDKNAEITIDKGTVDIQIDRFLIAQAEAALERYPKTVTEQIEQWAYLGSATESKLTDFEQLQLMCGEFEITLAKKENDKGNA